MIRPGKMLREAMNHLFKKPATIKYPAESANIPDKFRGKLKFYADKCIGCKLCMKDCPSDAIHIEKVGDTFEAVLDLDKCIYCAQCVDTCPKKALEATTKFELAQIDRKKLRVKINEK
jgi:formate hydrogenlyase subunit 6/NADH:ubiquinone oxidoreductase subunit I